jgi:hypothetical protein
MATQHKKVPLSPASKSDWNPKGRRKATARKKISTTIGPENYAFLESLIASGKAQNWAEAMDLVLEEFRRADNRARLEQATTAYYEGANPEAIAEENELAAALSASVPDLLFDE